MPKIVDHDQRREEILNGCFELWARRGHAAVTMREVAKTLAISTGTLYHYFRNKEELFRSMVRWLGERSIKRATALTQQTQDPHEKLKLLFAYINAEEDEFRRFLLIAVDYYRHQSSQTDEEAPLASVLAAFRQQLQEELQIDEPSADALLSMILGMLIQRMMDPHSASPQSYHQLLTQLPAFASLLSPS